MPPSKRKSLRSLVFEWCQEHPYTSNLKSIQEYNALMYEAFGLVVVRDGVMSDAEIEKRLKKQKILLEYRKQYEFELHNGKLDRGRNSRNQGNNKSRNTKNNKTGDLGKWSEIAPCSHCPGYYANELMKFVGFRGYLSDYQHPKDRRNARKRQFATIDMHGEAHLGEAYPPPIVPVSNANRANLMRLTGKTAEELGSNYFIGILRYEVEIMTLKFTLRQMGYENIMVLMPRGFGKTYMNAWDDETEMKWFEQNVMMLSVTNAKLKVGNWIYLWALRNKYLKNPEKFARKSTYQHFELTNDTRMDIYDFMSEDLVGEHDFKLKLDDIVKKKWRHKPTENEKAIEHWQSNINFIIRTGLDIYGTRKFEGDPLEHIMEKIDDLILIKQSPFISCPHGNANLHGTYDPCPICRDAALLAPEIHSFDELMDKMEEDYESWMAEMMQFPSSIIGGMVEDEDIKYVRTPRFDEGVQMCGVGVDLSWEDESETADMCAIISCVMHGKEKKDKRYVKRFTFSKADVDRFPIFDEVKKRHKRERVIKGVFTLIGEHVKFFEHNYPGIPIIIAIERNSGGSIIIKTAQREGYFWVKYLCSDKALAVKWSKEGKANVKLGITHTKGKVARVFGELQHSIKSHESRFDWSLESSIFMAQTLAFPKGKHDDGPDAGGMIKDELFRRWKPKRKKLIRKSASEKLKEKRIRESFLDAGEPWRVIQRKAASKVASQQRQQAREMKRKVRGY